MSAKQFKFLQFSDVHLDSKLASAKLSMPVAKRLLRSSEILDSALKALEIAKEEKVDAVLIPGDLWDNESITSQSLNAFIEALLELGDIPVIISPGNHDYAGANSLYNQQILSLRGMRPWPNNVHIFSSPEFSTFSHPLRPEISFTGRAFLSNVPVTERFLQTAVPKNSQAALNILLFHGSLDSYKGSDKALPGKVTAPFSLSELASLGFSYTALGHYHEYNLLSTSAGQLVGAYSGCLVGRTTNEEGPRYALLGTITYEEETTASPTSAGNSTTTGRRLPSLQANAFIELQPIEVDTRRIVHAQVDITGQTSVHVMLEIESELKKARPGNDIVILELEGRYPTGGEPRYVLEKLQDRYFHVCLVDQTRPDYLTEKYDKRTTEGKFIQAMLDLKKQAEASNGTVFSAEVNCEASARQIEDALYYGLDALRQKRISVRNVD
jgi:DNA repair exonuclease SbcCD nuclease subunit